MIYKFLRACHLAVSFLPKCAERLAAGKDRQLLKMGKFSEVYNTPEWKKLRAAYIKQHSLCENCLAKGICTPAVIVHHVKPITPEEVRNPMITLYSGNLKAVCRKCHGEEHSGRRYTIDEMGKVIT